MKKLAILVMAAMMFSSNANAHENDEIIVITSDEIRNASSAEDVRHFNRYLKFPKTTTNFFKVIKKEMAMWEKETGYSCAIRDIFPNDRNGTTVFLYCEDPAL